MVLGEDWDKIKEIFTNDESKDRFGKFFEYLPADCIKKKHRNEKGTVDQIVIRSEIDGRIRESIVYFDTVRSFKQNPMSAESSDWDFIHVDEPIPVELWTAVSRGLIDRGGYSWWLLTPIKEPWMYAEMIANTKLYPQLYWWFEATMDDNPLLSSEDKLLYINQLSEEEREARKLGKPLAYAKLVFGDFDEDYHVVESSR